MQYLKSKEMKLVKLFYKLQLIKILNFTLEFLGRKKPGLLETLARPPVNIADLLLRSWEP